MRANRFALVVLGLSLLLIPETGRAAPPSALGRLESLRVAHEASTFRVFVLEADGGADLIAASNVDGKVLSRLTLKARGTDGVVVEVRPVDTDLPTRAVLALKFSDGDVTTTHIVALDTSTGTLIPVLRHSGCESRVVVDGGLLTVTLKAQEDIAWYELDVDAPLAGGCKREVIDRFSSESKRATDAITVTVALASASGVRVEGCKP